MLGTSTFSQLQLWKGSWPLGGEIRIFLASNWPTKIQVKSEALFLFDMSKWTALLTNDMFKLEFSLIKHVIS